MFLNIGVPDSYHLIRDNIYPLNIEYNYATNEASIQYVDRRDLNKSFLQRCNFDNKQLEIIKNWARNFFNVNRDAGVSILLKNRNVFVEDKINIIALLSTCSKENIHMFLDKYFSEQRIKLDKDKFDHVVNLVIDYLKTYERQECFVNFLLDHFLPKIFGDFLVNNYNNYYDVFNTIYGLLRSEILKNKLAFFVLEIKSKSISLGIGI